MRHIVTGGAGFIGHHLVRALLQRFEDEVVVIDNFYRGRPDRLVDLAGDERLRVQEVDIRDAASLAPLFAGVDTVFHLAAQSNVIGAVQDPAYSAETNVLGTANVLQCSLQSGVGRVIFTSSREVYGDPAELPVREDAALAPKNFYGASKVAGEAYCRAFRALGLDSRILRLANVYGPGDTQRVIPIWVERALAACNLEVFGGDQVIDFVWVDQVVEALLRAASLPALLEPINIGSGRGTRILDLAARILQLSESPSQLKLLPARGVEVKSFVAHVGRMRDLLGLEPDADPLAGLGRLITRVAVA